MIQVHFGRMSESKPVEPSICTWCQKHSQALPGQGRRLCPGSTLPNAAHVWLYHLTTRSWISLGLNLIVAQVFVSPVLSGHTAPEPWQICVCVGAIICFGDRARKGYLEL